MLSGRVGRVAAVAACAVALAGCDLGAKKVMYSGPSTRVQAADVNGDGHLDLVTTTAYMDPELPNTPPGNGIFLGDGTGAFEVSTTAYGHTTSEFALGDVDEDGDVDRVDVAIDGTETGTDEFLYLLRNDGTGRFTPTLLDHPDWSDGWPFNTWAGIALGDLDGDGHLDLVAGDAFDGNLEVRSGDGTGAFGAPSPHPIGGQSDQIGAIEVRDVDGDDHADVVVLWVEFVPDTGAHRAMLTVLRGDGAGGLAPPESHEVSPGRNSAPLVTSLVVEDLDHDGADDLLALVSGESQASLFRGDGQGGFEDHEAVPLARYTSHMDAADVDGDGHLDLVTDAAGHGGVYWGDGTGQFPQYFGLAGDPAQGAVAADLDDDGRPDAVLSWTDGITVFMNRLTDRPVDEP
jgi:hypothetical protein